MIILAIVAMVLVGLTIIGHFALKNHLAAFPAPVSTYSPPAPQPARAASSRPTPKPKPRASRTTRSSTSPTAKNRTDEDIETELCQAMNYPPVDFSVPEYMVIDEDDMDGPTFEPDGTGNDETM